MTEIHSVRMRICVSNTYCKIIAKTTQYLRNNSVIFAGAVVCNLFIYHALLIRSALNGVQGVVGSNPIAPTVENIGLTNHYNHWFCARFSNVVQFKCKTDCGPGSTTDPTGASQVLIASSKGAIIFSRKLGTKTFPWFAT